MTAPVPPRAGAALGDRDELRPRRGESLPPDRACGAQPARRHASADPHLLDLAEVG